MYVCVQPLQHVLAKRIHGAINEAFIDLGVNNYWQSKVVGVGCDGAAVNIGRRNSVMTWIKDDHPYIIPMHCVDHRLELGILSVLILH